MDLKAIQKVINSELPFWEEWLLTEIAKDESVLPKLLKILDAERKSKDKLIKDMNLLLSKAHTGLEEPNFNKDGFMQKEITKFYLDNKENIGHCFKNIYKDGK